MIRESLGLKDLSLAKLKRDVRVHALRGASATGKLGMVRTMREVLELLRKDLVRILTDVLPLDSKARAWTRQQAQNAWAKVGKKYSASVANKSLGAMKKMAALMIEHGLRVDDPTRELKRMQQQRIYRTMPSVERMEQIIQFIRSQGKRGCVESSRFVAFLAFTGMRKGELAALKWEDVWEDWITVGADGNTKGKSFRMVPMTGKLRAVTDEFRDADAAGKVFSMQSPRGALITACEAMRVAPLRVHDTRHFFATWCIQSGIDIQTVAKWLGHSDGGTLAMKTYRHIRDDHSLEQAKKLAPAPVTPPPAPAVTSPSELPNPHRCPHRRRQILRNPQCPSRHGWPDHRRRHFRRPGVRHQGWTKPATRPTAIRTVVETTHDQPGRRQCDPTARCRLAALRDRLHARRGHCR